MIAGLFLSTAKATTVIPPTFEQLADRADLVFVGKVVGSRAEWRSVGTDRVIFTLVEFETQEVLKDIVVTHDGKALRDVAEIGAGEGGEFGGQRRRLSIPAERGPMSVEDFKERIRSHLARNPRQP